MTLQDIRHRFWPALAPRERDEAARSNGAGRAVRSPAPGPRIALALLVLVAAIACALIATAMHADRLARQRDAATQAALSAAGRPGAAFDARAAEAAQARDAAEGAERTLRLVALNAILASLVLVVAAVLVALQARSRVRRLLDVLMKGTQALQTGSAHRSEVVADGELERVVLAFNAMAGELQQYRRAAEATRVQLEDAVQARTAELCSTHATLQTVDARRRQFLEDISHELRTPATAIRGEAEIALRGPDKPVQESKWALQRVIATVKQMGVLIDDVLLLARVEADQQTLRRVAVPWLDALREAAELAEALGHEQHVEIRFAERAETALERAVEPAGPLLVHADPDRLRQALMVVLDNAVRYSRPQGEVTIGWRDEGDALCALVRDRGIGIDASVQSLLFVRHARGARARAHRADGSGLGLAIAQAIVQAHGGRIAIESRPGVGTTVRISVPRWRGDDEP